MRCFFLSLFISFILSGQVGFCHQTTSLTIQAKMKHIAGATIICHPHTLHLSKIREKDKNLIRLENSLSVTFSYNGYSPMKVILTSPSVINHSSFAVSTQYRDNISRTLYLYFHDTNNPVPSDGVLFSMDGNHSYPIMNHTIQCDFAIDASEWKPFAAGTYNCEFQINIVELE